MVYKKIEDMCKDRGISIYRLERDLGLGNGTIGGWRKTRPRIDLLKTVCEYFGVTLEEIMRKEEEKSD